MLLQRQEGIKDEPECVTNSAWRGKGREGVEEALCLALNVVLMWTADGSVQEGSESGMQESQEKVGIQ